jgi:hypothetical protein
MSLNKLKNLIGQSSLSENDKTYLLNLFSKAEDDHLSDITSLFEENPDLIKQLLEIYKLKEEAITKKDEKLWREVVNRELNLIKNADL